MSQHDFDIANQTASSARADINNALKALASLSSGAVAPTTTYANMFWYDTGTNILKQRNEADSAWINIGYLDQTGSQFQVFDDTKVVNTSGTQTGLIGDQATATWEAGTGTTESLVSPAKVKAVVDANISEIGVGQTWQDVTLSRADNTLYQNTTDKPIMAAVTASNLSSGAANMDVYVGTSAATLVRIQAASGYFSLMTSTFIIPAGHYYKCDSDDNVIAIWAELR